MKPVVLWVVGEPGCGKTTLVRELLSLLDPTNSRYLVAKPKWTVVPGVACFAGHYTGGTFDGADTVPYNGVEAALDAWASDASLHGCPLTVFDGDRFSLEKVVRFFDRSSVSGAGRPGPDVVVCVAHLSAPASVAQARRDARGSKQNASWVEGRKTKSRRFSESHVSCCPLDATKPVDELVEELWSYLRSRGWPGLAG